MLKGNLLFLIDGCVDGVNDQEKLLVFPWKYKVQRAYSNYNYTMYIIQQNNLRLNAFAMFCHMSRAGFFQPAAFYGGTALRIFYGLDRFSEDLDFSLKAPDTNFDPAAYLLTLEKEVLRSANIYNIIQFIFCMNRSIS